MKHTPGPWIVDFYEPTLVKTEAWLSSREKPFIASAEVQNFKGWWGNEREEKKANARLIAAAPELLEELVNIVEAHRDGIPNYVEKYIDDYKALIAKATGGD